VDFKNDWSQPGKDLPTMVPELVPPNSAYNRSSRARREHSIPSKGEVWQLREPTLNAGRLTAIGKGLLKGSAKEKSEKPRRRRKENKWVK